MRAKYGVHGLIIAMSLAAGWCVATLTVQDPVVVTSATDDATTAADRPLDTLDWLIGDWRAETAETTVEFSCKFSKNDAFLVRSFRVSDTTDVNSDKNMSGMQVVAWDPTLRTMRSWTFDSSGGFGEDVWTQFGDRYTLRTKYTLPDGGQGTSLNALTYIDQDRFAWQATHREIDGELQADGAEIVFQRMADNEADPTGE